MVKLDRCLILKVLDKCSIGLSKSSIGMRQCSIGLVVKHTCIQIAFDDFPSGSGESSPSSTRYFWFSFGGLNCRFLPEFGSSV